MLKYNFKGDFKINGRCDSGAATVDDQLLFRNRYPFIENHRNQ